jgi:hypothetical protein
MPRGGLDFMLYASGTKTFPCWKALQPLNDGILFFINVEATRPFLKLDDLVAIWSLAMELSSRRQISILSHAATLGCAFGSF